MVDVIGNWVVVIVIANVITAVDDMKGLLAITLRSKDSKWKIGVSKTSKTISRGAFPLLFKCVLISKNVA